MITFSYNELRALYLGLMMHEGEGCIGFLGFKGDANATIVAGHDSAKEKLEKYLREHGEPI